MKNTEASFKKDLEKLYFNTEGRFVDMYDSDPVHFINKQLEEHLGRKAEEEEIDELEVTKLHGNTLAYEIKYQEVILGVMSISRDRHDYKPLLHFSHV